MGSYRLILAVMVALSHMNILVFGRNQGSIAVISFYLLSGFVMTGLVRRYYLKPRLVPLFYLDRLARLYPQFFLYMTLAVIMLFLYPSPPPLPSELTPWEIAKSYLLFPLDFYMYGGAHPKILPPVWTLGLEACFYLVIPFILIYKWRNSLFYLSAFIFILAFAKVIPTDTFTYRLLPGTLFIFLCGSLMFDQRKETAMPPLVVKTCWAAAVFLVIAIAVPPVRIAENREVPIGLLLGIPLVWWLRTPILTWWDELAGNLSYGLFLNHYILIRLARTLFGVKTFHFVDIVAVLAAALVLATITFYGVERPFLLWRHRQRRSLAPASSPQSLP